MNRIIPQATFAILYMCLFLFMIIYLLVKPKAPNNLDYNTKETYTPHATASSYSMLEGFRLLLNFQFNNRFFFKPANE